MGVTHYLVDHAEKNVLCCEKWYALDPEDRANVTEADINAARSCAKTGNTACAVAVAATAWMRRVAQGRPVAMVTDSGDNEPWLDHQTYDRLPGWKMYELYGAEEGGLVPKQSW